MFSPLLEYDIKPTDLLGLDTEIMGVVASGAYHEDTHNLAEGAGAAALAELLRDEAPVAA